MSKIFVSLFSLLLLLFFSFFIVQENERGILLQKNNFINHHMNKIAIYTPGLHFKWPIVDTITILDARLHTINNTREHFFTKEKKDLFLNYYIKWKIIDFGRYYHYVKEKNFSHIELFLKREINDQLQLYISSLNMKEIIASSHQQLTQHIENAINNKIFNLNKWLLPAENSIKELGIKLVDIRIQKIALPDIMYNAVYNRMRSEQKAIARNTRIQGKERIQQLYSIIDHKKSIILAEAKKQALLIKGAGEAKVIQLFAKNFDQEPDFYFFIRSLRLYENSFKNNENIMFIDLNNELFQYIKKQLML